MLTTSHPSPAVGEWNFDVPKGLSESPLLRSGGYRVISRLIEEPSLGGLLAEAEEVRLSGGRSIVKESGGAEGRGGKPAHALRSRPGQDLHWKVHRCSDIVAALGRICGVEVAPAGGGTYSYYENPGDFLALHRDVVRCDVAVITCLSLRVPDISAGGLHVYPEYIQEPLSRVRAAGRDGGRAAPLAQGETIVLFGGILPHEVIPMAEGQERIVSVMCYRALIPVSEDSISSNGAVPA
jgi:hypothetical protein